MISDLFSICLDLNNRYEEDSMMLIDPQGRDIIIYSVIDGFPCYIQRPFIDNKLYYSGKEHAYVLRYQLLVTLTGKILSIFGPLGGSNNDLSLLDNSKMLSYVDENEYILGDGIYESRPHFLITKHTQNLQTEEEKKWNQELTSRRSIVENTIAKIKVFQMASVVYRGKDYVEHGEYVRLICCIVNLNKY